MKKGFIIFWCCLVGSLLLSISGFIIRFGNEGDNKAVVPVIDYNEFYRMSNKAHMNVLDVLKQLKEGKAETVAVKEVTLRNLAADGKAYVSTLGDFLSSAQNSNPSLAIKVKDLIGPSRLNPQAYVIITSDKDTAAFLTECLGRRFEKSQVVSMTSDNQSIFYLDAEFTDIGYVYLGFDNNLLNTLKSKGFKILLRPGNIPNTDYSYLEEFKQIIKNYDVKYMIFDGEEVTGFPEHLDLARNLIKDNNLITGMIEAPTQIMYTEQKGLGEIMEGTGYAINRVYIPYESDIFKLSKEDMFFRWIRGVIDRNIRFVYIRPLQNTKLKYSENIKDSITLMRDFSSFVESKGYTLNVPLKRLSTKVPGKLHYLAVSLSLTFALVLYLMYLFRPNKKIIILLTSTGVVGSVLLSMLLGGRIDVLLALAASILYPSFSSLLVLRAVIKNHKSLIVKIAEMIGILLVVNAMGAYTVVTTLSDIKYTMNIGIYRGVGIAFILPLVLFGVNYFFSFVKFGELKKSIIKLMNYNLTLMWAGIIAVAGAVVFIYLARSGNGVVAPSTLELRVREVFERVFGARPRFKEFIIGYPALLIMGYLYNRYKNNMLLLIFGAAVVIGSVSTVNSFCHVFTEISVSTQRTLNGLALGLGIGFMGVVAVKIVLDNYMRVFRTIVRLLQSSEKMNII